jgi:hypothetical protein
MGVESVADVLKRDIIRLAQVGAVTGSVAGWAGLIAAHGNAAVAGTVAASWTWLLLATLPLGLAAVTAGQLWRPGGVAYGAANALALARVLLVIGLIGGSAGVLLEFVVASYIPTLFSFWRLDGAVVRSALLAAYPWSAIAAALGATALAAVFDSMAVRLRQSK